MSKTADRIRKSLVVIIILTICLCLLTVFTAYAGYHEQSHSINLNDGIPVVEEYEYTFKPGMTIEKEFFIENPTGEALYYRLYFENLEGELKDYLEVTISDGKKTILKGRMKDLTKSTSPLAGNYLNSHEKKTLKMALYLSKTTDNKAQSTSIEFDLKATAVWTGRE